MHNLCFEQKIRKKYFLNKNLPFFLFIFIYFNSVLHPFQDYFSPYETGQSVGGAKTAEPREKTPDTPASRTWLVSHVAFAILQTLHGHFNVM